MTFKDYPYTHLDIDKVEADAETLIAAIKEATSAEAIKALLEESEKEDIKISSNLTLCHIRYSQDTTDDYYEKEMQYINEISPRLSNIGHKISSLLLDSPYKEGLRDLLGDHYFNKMEMSFKTFTPEIMDDLAAENNLSMDYDKLRASAEIEFKGETLNLSQMGPYLEDEDRAVRKEAHEKYYGFMADNQDQFDEIYDKLVKVRTTIAKKLGYDNFVELGYLRMQRMDYNQADVANFRKQVQEEIVPVATELYKRQQNRLGLDHLYYYDQSYLFTSGNPKPQGDADWIVEQAIKMYDDLSEDTSSFFRGMVERECLDLVARKGKSGGGYCTKLLQYETPFVFSNFNGTQGDITVMTHEIGHAFQGHKSMQIRPTELIQPSKESAEIHSMSMEFLTYPWMKNFFGPDTDKFFYSHITDGMLFIPYGVMVDEFQHWVYENYEATPAQRHAAWHDIENKYKPTLDFEDNEYLQMGGFWQRQAHIYAVPFYYIDYTLAQLCAYQFYAKSLEDRDKTWDDYVNLCSAGGTKPFLGLCEIAQLKSPFVDGTVKEVVSVVKDMIGKIDDSQF